MPSQYLQGYRHLAYKMPLSLHDGCNMWIRNFPPFRSTWVHSSFLVWFVLLDLQFSLQCFVDNCLPFCPFSCWILQCLSLYIQLLNTPLISSDFPTKYTKCPSLIVVFSYFYGAGVMQKKNPQQYSMPVLILFPLNQYSNTL